MGGTLNGRLAPVCVLLVSGCSLIAPPADVVPNEPTDGGVPMDGDMDGGMEDGGHPDGCPAVEAICGDGVDNDCDGLVDCVDYDCAPRPQCCTPGGMEQMHVWSGTLGVWRAVPTGSFSPTPREGHLYDFGTDVAAIVLATCQPMELGLELTGRFFPQGTGGSDFAALVLTPTDQRASTTARLLDDLAVTVTDMGDVTVTQAGVALAPTVSGYAGRGEEVRATISMTPGVAEGQPAMLTTVEIRKNGADPRLLLDAHPLLRRSDLVATGGCDLGVRGLYVGIEGTGTGVEVGTYSQRDLACADPSRFEAVDRVVVSQSPDASESLELGEWAAGGGAAPALVASQASMGSTTTRWDVFVDATDVDRRIELINDIGFSIGHSVGPGAWSSWAPMSGAPVLGSCHPSCVGMPPTGCSATCSMESAREPSVVGILNTFDVLDSFYVAAAQRVGVGNEYRIGVESNVGLTATTWSPTEVDLSASSCVSYRHPALVPAGTSDIDHGYWLFFTCERTAAPPEIHVARLSRTGDLREPPVPVLVPSDLGPYAAGGVLGPEILVQFREDGPQFDAVYRMWFVARDRGGARISVAVAQAQLEMQDATTLEVPVFTPYPANPVLPTASLPGRDCSDCRLTGLAATRLWNDAGRVRLLVARSVNTESGLRYELVPMEQDWGDPWINP